MRYEALFFISYVLVSIYHWTWEDLTQDTSMTWYRPYNNIDHIISSLIYFVKLADLKGLMYSNCHTALFLFASCLKSFVPQINTISFLPDWATEKTMTSEWKDFRPYFKVKRHMWLKKKKQQTKKHINLAWNIFEQKHWQ